MDAIAPVSEGCEIKGYTVELRIGPDEQPLFVHSALLSSNSEFFKAALKKNWKEGQKRVIKLPDDDYDSVYAYIRWMYSRKIFTDVKDPDGDPSFTMLADLYILGEKLIDNGFQDCVLNSIVSLTRKEHAPKGDRYLPSMSDVRIIYHGTPSSSPARKLLVHMYAAEGDPQWSSHREGVAQAPEEFKNDLITELLKNAEACKNRKTYPLLDDGVPCEYHKHDKDEPCHPGKD